MTDGLLQLVALAERQDEAWRVQLKILRKRHEEIATALLPAATVAEYLAEFDHDALDLDSVLRTTQVMRTAIYDVPPLPAWHVGRVMLLGDAAHAMSPAGGQGASLALEDALLVARGLAQRSRRVSDVFTEVESLLRLRAERIVRQAAQNDLRQLKRLGPVGQWMRDRIFPLFLPVIARELQREYGALARLADRPA